MRFPSRTLTAAVAAVLAALPVAGPASASGPAPASGPLSASGPAAVFADGFEAPVIAGQVRRFPAGARLGPWTVTRGDVDLSSAALWQVAAGRQNLDLDGAGNGAVTTVIPVRPLVTYRISYALAGNPAAAPRHKTGEVRVDGITRRFDFDTSRTSLSRMGTTRQSFSHLALSGSMTLEFASTTTPPGHGPVIDDVRVDSCLLVLCPAVP
jgi:Protein of unknown function (DUF642)